MHRIAGRNGVPLDFGRVSPQQIGVRGQLAAVLADDHPIVIGEMMGVQTGLGAMILDGRQLSRADVVVADMAVIGLLGFLSDFGVLWLGRRLLRWSPSHAG